MEIKNFASRLLAEKGGEKLTKLLRGHGKKDILLLIAGGSSMQMLEYVDPKALGPHITITMLDERFSTDPKISNFLQLKTLPFYEQTIEANVSIFDTSPQEGKIMERLVKRWESFFREWAKENPKGVVISTFGIGEDGHIAGVMPFPEDPQKFTELFENEKRLVVGYDAGPKTQFPLRVTVTLSFLRNHLTAGVVFVSGEKKRPALELLQAPGGTLWKTPARIFLELSSITFFTDLKLIV